MYACIMKVSAAIALALSLAGPAVAQDGSAPKPATAATKAANDALKAYLDFDDRQDSRTPSAVSSTSRRP